MKFNLLGFALAASSALSLCVPAFGAVVTQYSNRATWEAATSGRYDINFSKPSGSVVYSVSSTGLNFIPAPVSSSVNFVGYYNEGGPTQNLLAWTRDDGVGEARWNFGSGGLLAGGANGDAMNVYNSGISASFGSVTGIRSVGFNYAAWQQHTTEPRPGAYPLSNALRLEVYESNTLTQTINLTNSTAEVLAFIGIHTTGDISGIRLATQNIFLNTSPFSNGMKATAILDNFSFGALVSTGGGGGGGSTSELPEPTTFLSAAAACFLIGIRLRRK